MLGPLHVDLSACLHLLACATKIESLRYIKTTCIYVTVVLVSFTSQS